MAFTLMATGIISGIVDIYDVYTRSGSINDAVFFLDISSEIILFAGGLFILFIKNYDLRFIIGSLGIIIGLSDFTSSLMTLYDHISVSNLGEMIFLLIYALIPLTDLLLAVFSVRYMQGHKRNAFRMAIMVAVPLMIFLLILILTIGALLITSNLEPVFFTYLPRVILYGLFFWFLMLPSVREDLSEWKVHKLSEQLYRSTNTDPKASIYRGDLLMLMKKMNDRETWNDSELIPGAKEIDIVFGKDMFLKKMIFRIIEGSDKIRVSIINEGCDEYIQATRFDLRCVVPVGGDYDSCRSIRLFGDDGFFINISVRDDMPKPMKTYAIDRFIDRLKFKNMRD